MKREIAILLILFLFPVASAVQVDTKSEFSQGETLLAKISGNFINPLTKENIFFYRGHVRTPTIYEISKTNNDYYLYAQLLGKASGNYSLAIENTRYMK